MLLRVSLRLKVCFERRRETRSHSSRVCQAGRVGVGARSRGSGFLVQAFAGSGLSSRQSLVRATRRQTVSMVEGKRRKDLTKRPRWAERRAGFHFTRRDAVTRKSRGKFSLEIRKPSGSPYPRTIYAMAPPRYCTVLHVRPTRKGPPIKVISATLRLSEATRRLPPDRDALAAADCLESKAGSSIRRCRLASRQDAKVVEGSVKADEASLQVTLLSASLFPVQKACQQRANSSMSGTEGGRERVCGD